MPPSRGGVSWPSCRRSRSRVTEHRLHRVCCPACATVTTAEPPAASRWAFGPRLQAAVVTLAVRNRVSRRDTTELARELFGVELATGTVDAIIQRAGDALAGPYTELEQRIKTAAAVNIDETGWKTCGGGRTLWGALTSRTAVFRIAAGRHAFEARTLLGERFAGIVCSDRWRGYDYLDPSQRQLCWAHLLRDFTAHSEGMAEQTRLRLRRTRDRPRPLRRLGRLPGRQRPGPAASADRAAPGKAPNPARARRPQEPAHQVPPRLRHATSSSAGPRSGPSPTPTASNRPTTTPSAASAAPSSTASSHSAANPNEANAPSNDSSPPRSPADSANSRSSPTSPKPSPPTPAATQYPHSPDPTQG